MTRMEWFKWESKVEAAFDRFKEKQTASSAIDRVLTGLDSPRRSSGGDATSSIEDAIQPDGLDSKGFFKALLWLEKQEKLPLRSSTTSSEAYTKTGDEEDQMMAILEEAEPAPDVQIAFEALDSDDSGWLDCQEFVFYVQQSVLGHPIIHQPDYSVFETSWEGVLVYVLIFIAMIIQFATPMVILYRFLYGHQSMPAWLNFANDNFRKVPMTEVDTFGDETWKKVDGRFVYNPEGNPTLCPQISFFATKLCSAFLLLYLLVETDVKDFVYGIAVGEQKLDRRIMKFSRFTEDVFFMSLSPALNLLCFIFIMSTTYVLFVISPGVHELLLNVVAVNFLISVDDAFLGVVADEEVQREMSQKMLLMYLVSGEQTKEETENMDLRCALCKWIVELVVVTVFGRIAVFFYGLIWLVIPIMGGICM